MRIRSLFLALFLILGAHELCLADGGADYKVDWAKAEKFSYDSLEACLVGKSFFPEWKSDTYFYYKVREADGVNHYIVNAANGRRTNIIPNKKAFCEQYRRITGKEMSPDDIRIYGFRFRKGDMRRFFLQKEGKIMVYDIRKGILQEASEMPEGDEGKELEESSTKSADSLFTMLGCGYDLYLRDNRSGEIKRLTTDGKEYASYTTRNTPDTLEDYVSGRWCGLKFISFIRDRSEIKEMALINSLAKPRPKVRTYKMPMPGDEGVERFRIFWYAADKGEGGLLPIDKYPDQVVEMRFPDKEDTTAYFTRRSRKGDKMDLCRINLENGKVTELISEECLPHINVQMFNYLVTDDEKYIIWWSERTGNGNYYLYDHDGRLLNRITQGDDMVAGRIIRVDEKDRSVIFSGYGNEEGINPYYAFYYKVGLDGRGQKLLTPGDGTHELTLSGNGQYAVDIYSRADKVPVMSVLSVKEPSRRHVVDSMDVSELLAAGWKAPRLIKVKAADDSTDLYGLMYLPTNLDPDKKYPIISNVYPGPQDDQIPRGFTIDDGGNQQLAELGFVVISVPSRGSSPLRGRDFYNFGYGNLRDYPLVDDKNTIETLAKEYSFIDLDRVGVYGHSGGAFQAVTAMLTYPEFYKVAVGASGDYDCSIYIQWWGELYQGLEEKVDSLTGKTRFSVNIPTTMELADRLRGRLLLITGDVDNNVPPSSTYRLADALIKAGKRFDMMVLPGKDHGVMSPYYLNMIRYYFVENLLQPQRFHINIINHN